VRTVITLRLRSAAAIAATVVTAALLGPLGVAIPTVRADPLDDKFLAALASQSITYRAPDGAIGAAHLVCTRLDQGADKGQVAQEVMDNSDLDPYHAGYFVGASVGAYCPQYAGP
jgi:Protein of unknown function (DUF732)